MRYMEDFQPGQIFSAGPVEITAEEVMAFASRYDPQPFHTDLQAAEDSFFKGLAASGWMTASLTMRMLVECGLDIAGGLIGREVELGWPRPTYAGDVVRTLSEVLEVVPSRSKPERGMIRVRTETLNQRDEVVQTMTARLMVHARPQG
ncbi:MAG TPA: MaoC family dehydratase [Candidatus Sulfotelmatobacter sp.]|nr:MaoC family dehydratase [Candidatus Sulfotelmatobacter sp.]